MARKNLMYLSGVCAVHAYENNKFRKFRGKLFLWLFLNSGKTVIDYMGVPTTDFIQKDINNGVRIIPTHSVFRL